MPRVKRKSKFKHNKILKLSKGFFGRRRNTFKISKQAVIKSLYYSYRDRIKKRKIYKKFFIIFINFFLRNYNISYNLFIYKLNLSNLILNKKILYDIILFNKFLFFLILKKINLLC